MRSGLAFRPPPLRRSDGSSARPTSFPILTCSSRYTFAARPCSAPRSRGPKELWTNSSNSRSVPRAWSVRGTSRRSSTTSERSTGRDRLEDLPLSIRLIGEIHADLMAGVRGREREPGEIRRSQNWIGGSTLANAAFVPPPVHEMWHALDQWEKYLHDDSSDPLIQAALMHAQFETIHPFLDGNGRVGRLLVPLLLQERRVLERRRALLYPSVYLKLHRDEYYQRLTRIRTEGDWEGWVDFFLEAIRQVAHEGQATIRDVLHLREEHRAMAAADGRAGANNARALDALVREPAMTAAILAGRLDVSEVTAMSVINRLSALGLLRETPGRRRHRVFSYEPYLDLFSEASFQRRVESAPKPPGLPIAP